MQTLTLVHTAWGIFVHCSCVCQNGIWLTPRNECNPLCDTHRMGYLRGQFPPRYPMPAIRYETVWRVDGSALHLCANVFKGLMGQTYFKPLISWYRT